MSCRAYCARFSTVAFGLILVSAVAAAAPKTSKTTKAGAGDDKAAVSPEKPAGFRIERFAPTGACAPNETVTVEFNSDMVKLPAGAAQTSASVIVMFDPHVDGTFRWESARKVRFVPRGGLRPCTRYVARVSPLLRNLAGGRLEGATEFDFNTPPLALTQVEQTGFTPDHRAIVSLHFSDAVAPSELHKFLSVQSGGKPLKWRLESDVRNRSPRIITDPVTTGTLSVRVEAGMRGAGGPLGLESATDRVVPLTFKLVAEQLTATWSEDRAYLVIRFSNHVRLANIREFITVEPATQFDVTDEGARLLLSGDFKPFTRYTVKIKQGLQGSNDQLLLESVTLSTWVPPMKPFLELKDAGGHLSTRGNMKLRVRNAGISSFRLRASRVYDNNLVYFVNLGGGRWDAGRLGREVMSKEIPVEIKPGKAVTTEVDLRDFLTTAATGVYMVEAEAERPPDDSNQDDNNGYYSYRFANRMNDSALISLSDLGIVAKRGESELAVWVAGLNSAMPIEKVHVRAYTGKNQLVAEGDTGADGMVMFRGLQADAEMKPEVVVASLGGDLCHLDLRRSFSGAEELQSEGRPFLGRGYEAFFTGERGAYRPGETAHLFGFVRGTDGALPPGSFPLELEIERPDGRRMEPRAVTSSDTGAVAHDFRIPNYAPTGFYRARLQLPGTAERREKAKQHGEYPEYDDEGAPVPASGEREELGVAEFFVEEFLPNRLKVEATAPDRRFSTSEPLTVSVKASEMFGQPAGGRAVDTVAVFRAEPFAPARFRDYTFGDTDVKFEKTEIQLEEATVGENGEVAVIVEPPAVKTAAALRAEIQVTVKDVGGRGVTSMVERVLDPAPFYLGVKMRAETYASAGKEAVLEVVGVKPDEALVDSATLTATVSRVRFNSILRRDGSAYSYVTTRELDPLKDFGIVLANGKAEVAWTPPGPGQYVFKVSDAADGAVTSYMFHAASPLWDEQPWSMEKPERLELVLDRKQYAVGDTARLLVKAPFAGTLLLTLEQDRVLSSSVHKMAQNTHEILLPVTEPGLPNFYAVATVLRPVKPAEKWLPHRAFGMVNVVVGSEPRRIAVTLGAPAEVRPKSGFAVGLELKDAASSAPAVGEVALWAVDEGVLSLTGFRTPDPLGFFYGVRRLMVATADFFSELMPDIVEPAKAKSAPGGGGMDERKRLSPVAADRVKPVVVWLGTLKTDAQGKATGEFKVPQFMGQLRVMAVAATGNRFGYGAATVFVRNPVMVKENLPRFLAPGDTAGVPFVVYNNTDKAATAQVVLETSGPIRLVSLKSGGQAGEAADRRASAPVEVPARGMAVALAEFEATDPVKGGNPVERAGIAAVGFSATMGDEAYSDSVELAVRPPSPLMTYTGCEVVAPGETKTLPLPDAEFLDGTTSCTVAVSGLPSLELGAGLRFNAHYPYGCAEQTVSSAFPLLFLGDLAAQVEPGRYSREGVAMMIQGGIDRVLSMQTASGGISMWPGEREPWPWGSVYAAHFLVEARKAGYVVLDGYLEELLSYVRERFPEQGGLENQEPQTQRCYAAYVLAVAGKASRDRMERLYEQRGNLTPTARALLASAYLTLGGSAEARELLKVSPSGSDARDSGGILSSPARETAVLLAAHLDANPDAAEVPALAKRLNAFRKEAHWGTTQDNAFALWALGRYLNRQQTGGKAEGNVAMGSGEPVPYSTSNPALVGVRNLADSVRIAAQGDGKTFAYWVAEGVPLKADTTTVSKGIEISRRFTDRSGKALQPDRLEQGKLVVVEVTVKCDRAVQNVVIEDLLPAGLEIENANLATSEQIDGNGGFAARRTEARDDRMLVFVDLSATGKAGRVFRYACRAVTAGTFVLPPVQASCMYDPSVGARSSAGVLRVLPRGK